MWRNVYFLMRETLAHYIFMFLRVIPTLDLASAYVDEGGFYGGIFCWNATLSDLFDVVKKKYMLSLFFFSSFLMEKCKRWFFQCVGYFIHVWWKCPVKDDIKSFCQRYQSILSKIPIKVYTINHLPLLCWQTRMEFTKIVYNLKT